MQRPCAPCQNLSRSVHDRCTACASEPHTAHRAGQSSIRVPASRFASAAHQATSGMKETSATRSSPK
eukprot:1861075-Rhodomonas_salina.2